MPISIGARLGPYEIVAPLGAGGMGEVYRARDPRLGRDIAIKVLPAAAAGDEERRGRFEREARAVAALNHPNIVTIYAVEEAGGIPFFTMEYIEGRTLRDLIPARGLALDELLKIAIPLTDAVSAAHQRGILHRDLKPANVMMTADGRVKVLDFGLAKLKEALLGAAEGTQATTEATGEGRILGTAAYMSPEQAEGKALDARSDVFSLGVVLYEMATGERPFKGDTNVSIISSILKDMPGSVTELRPELPRDLGKIVKHALSKDPEHRYQTAKDLRNDLEALKADLDSGELQATAGRAAALTKGRWPWWAWGASALAAVALAAVGTLGARYFNAPSPAPSAARPFEEVSTSRLTADGNAGYAVAVSPDGRYVAYAFVEPGREGLRVRQIDAAATVTVVAPAEVIISGLTFTPDGSRLCYSAYPHGRGQADLYEVPVLGGTPHRLLEDVDRGVSFSPDGTRLAFFRGVPSKAGAIVVASADGTGERKLAERQVPNDFGFAAPAWSPDGRVIAASAYEGAVGKVALYQVNADTGSVQRIGSRRWNDVYAIRWMPSGSALLVTGPDRTVSDASQIWLVEFPGGTAHRITNDVAGYTLLGLSADGRTLAASRMESRGSLWVGPAAQPDRAVRVAGVASTVADEPIRWTADGRILYTASAGSNYDVWVARPDGTDVRQLTSSPGYDGFPSITPDGRRVVFVSGRDGKTRVWRMELDASHQTPLTDGPDDWNPVVSADGSTVYYSRLDQQGEPMCRIPIDGGSASPVSSSLQAGGAASVPTGFRPHALSPDGALLLGNYFDDKEARTRFAIVRTDLRAAAKVLDVPVSLGFSRYVAWAPGGRAITFVSRLGGAANLWRQPIDGGAAAQVTHFAAGDAPATHAWSPDGKLLAMVRSVTSRDVVMIRDQR